MKSRKTRRLKRRKVRKSRKVRKRTSKTRRKKQLKGGAGSVKDIDKELYRGLCDSIYILLRDNIDNIIIKTNISSNEEDIKDIILQLLISGFNFELNFNVEDYTFTRILSDILERVHLWQDGVDVESRPMNENVFENQDETNIPIYRELLNKLYTIILY
jgi:hypothetical protein